jgi:hypothetical protein
MKLRPKNGHTHIVQQFMHAQFESSRKMAFVETVDQFFGFILRLSFSKLLIGDKSCDCNLRRGTEVFQYRKLEHNLMNYYTPFSFSVFQVYLSKGVFLVCSNITCKQAA